jgi:hypothetical protein
VDPAIDAATCVYDVEHDKAINLIDLEETQNSVLTPTH